jgi:transposase
MSTKPLYVRAFTDAERRALETALHSPEAFVLRRAQILLGSDRGEGVRTIGALVGFSRQAVRQIIHRFNREGVSLLKRQSNRNHTLYYCFDSAAATALRELLHQSPRLFGKETSVWTLELAAEVAFERGLTSWRVSGETVRVTLVRMGVRWKRAKHWITSPDPEYASGARPADPVGSDPS